VRRGHGSAAKVVDSVIGLAPTCDDRRNRRQVDSRAMIPPIGDDTLAVPLAIE
jgi:hypothetical protein